MGTQTLPNRLRRGLGNFDSTSSPLTGATESALRREGCAGAAGVKGGVAAWGMGMQLRFLLATFRSHYYKYLIVAIREG